jgi:glutathione S-transferase
MTAITIHHARRARSVRVIWLLEELGIPYEVRPIEFNAATLRSAEYMALHPLGQVPVVDIDGKRMIESGAIVEYLLEQHGAGRLAPPPGSEQRAEYLQWFHYGEATLARYVSDFVRNRFGQPEEERVPEILPNARRRFREALSLVDSMLAQREYVLGREFSAADIMVSYGITMSKVIGELPDDLSHVKGYLDRLKQRPGYQRAWA